MYLVWCLAFALAVAASGRRPQYRDVETQTDQDVDPDPFPPSRAGGGACCAVLTVIGMSFFVFALYMTVRDSF